MIIHGTDCSYRLPGDQGDIPLDQAWRMEFGFQGDYAEMTVEWPNRLLWRWEGLRSDIHVFTPAAPRPRHGWNFPATATRQRTKPMRQHPPLPCRRPLPTEVSIISGPRR